MIQDMLVKGKCETTELTFEEMKVYKYHPFPYRFYCLICHKLVAIMGRSIYDDLIYEGDNSQEWLALERLAAIIASIHSWKTALEFLSSLRGSSSYTFIYRAQKSMMICSYWGKKKLYINISPRQCWVK